MLNMIGIYKITSPSNKVYIGQSINIEQRFLCYKKLKASCVVQRMLYNSLCKYTPQEHLFEVICEVKEEPIQDKLNELEIYYWGYYKNLGYDMLNIREPGRKGKCSAETILKMSLSKKGIKQSPEHIANRSGIHNGMYGKRGELAPFYGKKQPEEYNRANSERMKGKQCALGFKHTKEHCEAMGLRQLGGKNHEAKAVVDTETGIRYDCIKDAARELGISYTSLKYQLKTNNKTTLVYENRGNNSSDK